MPVNATEESGVKRSNQRAYCEVCDKQFPPFVMKRVCQRCEDHREEAVYRLLAKFYAEVGNRAEAEGVVSAFGFESWDEWHEARSARVEADLGMPRSWA